MEDSQRRVTRSMTKSGTHLQHVVVNRNNQVNSRKRKTRMSVYLPEEIIFRILLLLPAHVLHNVIKLVCRTWREIVRDPFFTKAHLLQSAYYTSFRVVDFNTHFQLYCMNTDGFRSKYTTKMIKRKFLAHGVGLILSGDWDDNSILYLLNPITKQIITLPRAPIKYTSSSKSWALSYSPSTSKYKVVYVDYSCRKAFILTIGVDKEWRKILVEPDLMSYIFSSYKCDCVQGICGLIYWYDCHENCVIVLDLEEEILYKADFPEEIVRMKDGVKVISSDKVLSIAVLERDKYWQFWEMVDYKIGGEWRELGKFDYKSKKSDISKNIKTLRVSPFILKGRDEVRFCCNNFCFNQIRTYALNFKSGVVSRSYNAHMNPTPTDLMFMNSLVVL